MRVNHSLTKKQKIILWSLAGVLVAGVWGVAVWMNMSLQSLENRQVVVLTGVVSDIARNGSALSVGSFYGDPDGISFTVSAGTVIQDAQENKKTISDVRAGFPVRVAGYAADGDQAVAQTITLLDEPPIVLYEPAPHTTVSGSVLVRGTARVFENQFVVQLVGASGNVLAQESAYAHAPDVGQYGDFAVTLAVPPSASGTLSVRAFDPSPKDGSPLGLVQVPLTATPGDSKTMSVKVFWGAPGDNQMDCTAVVPLERTVAATSSVARAAIAALLAGPTDAEKADGYFSSIPIGVRLQKLSIVGGIAYADFDQTLDRGVGGSCRVAAIRAQITKTLMQFSTVDSVVISIDGRTGDILQP